MFYPTQEKRVVLCGINPGRNGAGKTGIPFIDFSGASHLLSGIGQNDSRNNKIEGKAVYIKTITDLMEGFDARSPLPKNQLSKITI